MCLFALSTNPAWVSSKSQGRNCRRNDFISWKRFNEANNLLKSVSAVQRCTERDDARDRHAVSTWPWNRRPISCWNFNAVPHPWSAANNHRRSRDRISLDRSTFSKWIARAESRWPITLGSMKVNYLFFPPITNRNTYTGFLRKVISGETF